MNTATQPATNKNSLPSQAQVVIIGGGVIGTSIAYHLTKLGWRDVVLLEKSQLTSGTTWHAAGLVVTPSGNRLSVEMSTYTIELMKLLEAETGQSTGFNPVGYLQLACTPEWLEEKRRKARIKNAISIQDKIRKKAGRWDGVAEVRKWRESSK